MTVLSRVVKVLSMGHVVSGIKLLQTEEKEILSQILSQFESGELDMDTVVDKCMGHVFIQTKKDCCIANKYLETCLALGAKNNKVVDLEKRFKMEKMLLFGFESNINKEPNDNVKRLSRPRGPRPVGD